MPSGHDDRAKPETGKPTAAPAVVKKYANRRLYNTATSSYVTLDELSAMVRQGEDFVVFDAKSGEDITRSVLTQIILEEDSKGRNLLPISFLRQVISFYDDSLHAVVPRYLEVSMENFARHQDQMRAYMETTLGRFFPMSGAAQSAPFEELTRQNMAMFQQAARMFSPFTANSPDQDQPPPAGSGGPTPPSSSASQGDVDALRRQLDEIQQQLDSMKPDPDKP